jgi:hypothetical protein
MAPGKRRCRYGPDSPPTRDTTDSPRHPSLLTTTRGFKPKTTEVEANNALADQVLQSGPEEPAGATELELPKLGDPWRETTPGFFTIAYPELFSFGRGDFNEARKRKVEWDEWSRWVLNQDSGEAPAAEERREPKQATALMD